MQFPARFGDGGLTGFQESMQKPNYQFEKRRKEMDKKAKKEAKRQQKLTASRSPAAETEAEAAPSSPAEPA